MRRLETPTFLLLASLLLGCGGEEPAPPAPTAEAPAAGAPTAEAPAADAPATGVPAADPAAAAGSEFAPLSSRTAAAGSPQPGAELAAPGATFTLPGAWRQEAPSSSMRLAQAVLPGDGGDAQLTVFYFGPGGGGGVEMNLQRWIGQVDPDPDGVALQDSFDAGGFRVTWVDVAGTLKPSTMGTGPTAPQPGSRLLAAVVEGPEGPWFFKATGPAATLEAHRGAFLDMLRSVR